jgi:hypothetical protein
MMNIKSNLKYCWLIIGVFAMSLTILLWFGYDSQNLQNTILVLNGLMLILSLPCSLFAVPILALGNHYLEINPISTEGIYLSTFFLFILGFMQWFWVIRVWSPPEPQLQMLDLLAGESK